MSANLLPSWYIGSISLVETPVSLDSMLLICVNHAVGMLISIMQDEKGECGASSEVLHELDGLAEGEDGGEDKASQCPS